MPVCKPGLSQRQAYRFRKAFRGWCEFYGATYAHVGEVLDGRDRLRGRWEEGGGPKAVANAMLATRKLTHRMARRLVVALLLSTPAFRASKRIGLLDNIPDEAQALLIELGAVAVHRPQVPAAFVLPASINALAQALAETAANALCIRKGRPELEKAIGKSLRADAALMARAFCDTISGSASRTTLDSLAQKAFGDAYIWPSQGAPTDVEFSQLYRVRPELATVEIPLSSWNRRTRRQPK